MREYYLKVDDVASMAELCKDIECKDCIFNNTESVECKLMLWIGNLKMYEVQMVEKP